jgi:hypothetical protein
VFSCEISKEGSPAGLKSAPVHISEYIEGVDIWLTCM